MASGVGIAVAGTVLAVLVGGDVAAGAWDAAQTAQFHLAVRVGGLALTAVAAALVAWGIVRTRRTAGYEAPSVVSLDDAQTSA